MKFRSPVFGPKSCSVTGRRSQVCGPRSSLSSLRIAPRVQRVLFSGPGGHLPVPWPVAACAQHTARAFIRSLLHQGAGNQNKNQDRVYKSILL